MVQTTDFDSAATLAPDTKVPSGELVLKITSTERHGQLVRIRAARCLVGSRGDCTLRLRSRGVRPVHCLILRGTAGTFVRRWSADTRLNGQTFTDAPLVIGDRLGVGPLEFEVVECDGVRMDTFVNGPRASIDTSAGSEFPRPAFDLQRLQAQWNDERRSLHDDIARLSRTLETARHEGSSPGPTDETLRAEHEALQAERAHLKTELGRLEAELRDYRERAQFLEAQRTETTGGELAPSTAELCADFSLQHERKTSEQTLERAARQILDLQAQCEALSQELAVVKGEAKSASGAEHEAHAREIRALAAECETVRQDLARCREELALREENLRACRAELEQSVRAQEESAALARSNEARYTEQEQRFKELVQDHSELQANYEDIKTRAERSFGEARDQPASSRDADSTTRGESTFETVREEASDANSFQGAESDVASAEASDSMEESRCSSDRRQQVAASALDVLARYGRFPEQAPSNLFASFFGRNDEASTERGLSQEEAAEETEEEGDDRSSYPSAAAYDDTQEQETLYPESLPEESASAPVYSGPTVTSEPNIGDDDSIEAYMSRLLNRVRGGSESPARRVEVKREERTSAPRNPVQERPAPESSEERQVEMLDPTTFKPRASAPEHSAGLAAMRDVANQSTSAALTLYSKTKWLQCVAEKMLVAGCAYVCGFGLLGGMVESSPISILSGGISLGIAGTWTVFAIGVISRGVAPERSPARGQIDTATGERATSQAAQ